jgi:hypothetical protein
MTPADGGGEQPHKAHRQHKSGAKARKKKGKGKAAAGDDVGGGQKKMGKGKGAAGDDAGGEQKNPKVRYRFEQNLGCCPWSDLPGRGHSGSAMIKYDP